MKLLNGINVYVDNGDICLEKLIDGEETQYIYLTEEELDELYHFLQRSKIKEKE